MTAPDDMTDMTEVPEVASIPREEMGRFAHAHAIHQAEVPEGDGNDVASAVADETETETDDGAAAVGVDLEHIRLIEALLFASADPVSERVLARRLPEGVKLRPVLDELARLYAGRGIELTRAGKSWAFRTAPDIGSRLKVEVEVSRKPSRAAVETLAIVAYHQPVTRAEIEEIRGVQISKGTLDWLFERGWVKPGPRREVPGRPVTWLTTETFLDHFGLQSEKDLPGLDELKAAGLLDAGPATYGSRGALATEAEMIDMEAAAAEGEAPEPLDPDGEAKPEDESQGA